MNPSSYYTRMFPQLARPPSSPGSLLECGLAELGKRMKRSGGDEGSVLAGLTYLAQFIDHDLTFDTTPLARAHPHAERIPNFRSPFLDLDNMYGGGPSQAPFLYEITHPPGAERLLIGKTTDGTPKDLPRNSAGIALVADPRQDENLIIAQLHVFFLERHNWFVDELLGNNVRDAGPAGATVFEQARRLSTWWYQRYAVSIIGNLVDRKIFNTIREQYAREGYKTRRFRIPIEFSVAAFRFGHSMVRGSYDYNESHGPKNPASLQDLLERTGMGGGTQPSLPSDWVMDLSRFLMFQNPPSNNAKKISPRVASELHQLHSDRIKLFNAPLPADQNFAKAKCVAGSEDVEKILPVRNLWRGARMGLPSGQDIAKVLSISPLTGKQIADGLDEDILTDRRYAFDKDTPLWYYILKEAELRGNGEHLGPVGSWIVAHTIFGALCSDPNSYLSVNPTWELAQHYKRDVAKFFPALTPV
jgi:Animal haem peroxidase